MVREHHKGPAVPTRLDCDINFIISKLKTAAETAIPEGLGMLTELEFIIKKSDEVLAMRHATAKDLYQRLGLAAPDLIEHVEVTNQPSSNYSRSSSNSSNPQRENSAANRVLTQADMGEGLNILRGVKRSLEAAGHWVPEEAAPNSYPIARAHYGKTVEYGFMCLGYQ